MFGARLSYDRWNSVSSGLKSSLPVPRSVWRACAHDECRLRPQSAARSQTTSLATVATECQVPPHPNLHGKLPPLTGPPGRTERSRWWQTLLLYPELWGRHLHPELLACRLEPRSSRAAYHRSDWIKENISCPTRCLVQKADLLHLAQWQDQHGLRRLELLLGHPLGCPSASGGPPLELRRLSIDRRLRERQWGGVGLSCRLRRRRESCGRHPGRRPQSKTPIFIGSDAMHCAMFCWALSPGKPCKGVAMAFLIPLSCLVAYSCDSSGGKVRRKR